MHRVRLSQEFSVPDEIAVSHLDRIACHADDPLYEILRAIHWPLEDDDVASLWRADLWKLHAGEWDFCPIDELVHEEEVAGHQRSLHASGGNLECFDEESANEKEKKKSEHDRAEPLP